MFFWGTFISFYLRSQNSCFCLIWFCVTQWWEVGSIDKITNECPNGQDGFDKFSVIHIYLSSGLTTGQTGKQKKLKYIPIAFCWIITPHLTKFTLVIINYHTLVSDGYNLSILGKIWIVQEDDVYKKDVTSKVL